MFKNKRSQFSADTRIRQITHNSDSVQNRYSLEPALKNSCQQSRKISSKQMHAKKKSLVKGSLRTSLYNNKGKNRINQYAWNTYIGNKHSNEDRVSLNLDFEFGGKNYSYFAIFDGHGGSTTSQFLYNNLFKMFKKQIKLADSIQSALKKALVQAQARIQALFQIGRKDKSGSCALVCIIHGEHVYLANVGDSRAILLEQDGKLTQLTNDHKPEHQRLRIQSMGCKVYRMTSQSGKPIGPYRIWPCKLSVSRTIGDISIKRQDSGSAISSIPDVFKYDIKKGAKLILMSDGAYQTLSNEEICQFFSRYSDSAESIDRLILTSVANSASDNISIIAVNMH